MTLRFIDHNSLRVASERGFSLVETIFAMGLSVTSAIALLGGISWSVNAVALVRDNDFATQILVERMETIRLYSLSQITSSGFLPKNSTISDPANAQKTYALTMTVTTNFLAANYAPNLAQVTLDLQWKTGNLQRLAISKQCQR